MAQLEVFGPRSFLSQIHKHLSLQYNFIWPRYCPSLEDMAKDIIRFCWDRTSLLPYEPDILASQRYLKSYRRATPAEPEKALMFAILAEAVETYQRFAFSESPGKQRLFREAKAWFWGEEPGCLFSFQSICEVFGLDPAYLRRGLSKLTANPQRDKSWRKRIQLRSGRSRTRKQVITLPDKSSSKRLSEDALM